LVDQSAIFVTTTPFDLFACDIRLNVVVDKNAGRPDRWKQRVTSSELV
jgi:hypothetical protein